MTAPNYAEMTDAQLNEAAARAMGLCGRDFNGVFMECLPPSSSLVGAMIPVRRFDPANDHNHAAEFSAWFRAKEREAGRKWTTTTINQLEEVLTVTVEYYKVWMALRSSLEFIAEREFIVENIDRPRAETIATLLANDAMAGKKTPETE